jgi:hypothetical protein
VPGSTALATSSSPSLGSGRAAPWAPPPRANDGKGMAELQRERGERQFSAPSRGFSSS